MQSSNRLPRVAAVVAFGIVGIVLLGALVGPIVVLPFALVPLCAGIGILRGRVWSAYGFATIFFAQLFLITVLLVRHGYVTVRAPQIVYVALSSLTLGILFLFTGRSLAASGAAQGWASPWIVTAALTVVPFIFVQTFEIASGSMGGTLLRGDRILAQVLPRPNPARGEMVLFLSPAERGEVLIKRIIAVPGDRIRIVKKVVILNGAALDEKYVTHDPDEDYGEDFPSDSAPPLPECAAGHAMLSRQEVNGEIVVPAGQYFVLGDRREDSLDSRCWGFIRSGDLIGKPLMIYDSIDRPAGQTSSENVDWLGQRRWSRLFMVL